MGTQATGNSGTSAATRLTYVVLGAGLVTLFAGLLFLSGAESAEVIATLLFAVVFAATLLVGRTAGFAVAVVSTLAYAGLRQDAMDDAGTAMWVLVVLGRAVSYLVLAYVTDTMRNRMPRLPFGPGSGSSEPSSPAPSRRRAAGGGAPTARPAGFEPEPAAPWHVGAPTDDTTWQAAPMPMSQPPGPPTPYPGQPAVDPWAPESQWDGNGPDGQPWAPEAPAAMGPAPVAGGGSVPSGWLQDEDYGDEIPVGYTGELFLQDLTAPPSDEPAPADDVAPMIDGMPFGQPLDAAPGLAGANGYDHPGGSYGYPEEAGDLGHRQSCYADSDPYPDNGATSSYGAVGVEGPECNPEYNNDYYAPAGGAGYDTAGHGGGGVNGAGSTAHHIDPETRLWTAGFFRDRLSEEYGTAHATGQRFSVVMIQIPDTPFQTLSYRRQVALLRELGHQFIRAQVVDHLVHLPDGDHHWFAAVLSGTDRSGAHAFERRLRSAIAGYLRNRGVGLADIQSATLTSPDDDATMSEIWSSLLGGQEEPAPNSTW